MQLDKYVSAIQKDGAIVVQLKKALYGCVEAARLWYEYLRKNLEIILMYRGQTGAIDTLIWEYPFR